MLRNAGNMSLGMTLSALLCDVILFTRQKNYHFFKVDKNMMLYCLHCSQLSTMSFSNFF